MVAPLVLAALRATATAKRASAGAKISRSRKAGVELGGTRFDPRRAPGAIKNYNERQLRSYISELESFNARSNQFVAGAEGAPIRRETWQAYQRMETAVNIKTERNLARIANLKPPHSGMTIGQREATLEADNVAAAGKANNKPLFKVNREHVNIAGEDAVKTLTKNLTKKLARNYIGRVINRDRERVDKIFEKMGMHDIREMLSDLSNDQFNVLWNHTQFASGTGSQYWHYEAKGTKDKRWHDVNFEGQKQELYDFVKWAKNDFTEA